jgi:hypothetical protein
MMDLQRLAPPDPVRLTSGQSARSIGADGKIADGGSKTASGRE